MHGFEQGQIVQFGVVRQSHNAAACIGLEGGDGIVGHVHHLADLRYRPAAYVFLARVADGDGETIEQRHRGQIFGQRARANQQHAVAGAKVVGKRVAVKLQRIRLLGQLQAGFAGGAVHATFHQRSGFKLDHQLLQTGGVGVELQQQL